MPTNLLNAPGTNGFISAPITVLSTELNALGSGAAATSSVNGASGVFTQTDFGSAPWLNIYFIAGGASTPVLGQCIYGWFLRSPDGGITFESAISTPSATIMALPRAADFIIPLDNAALSTGNIKWSQTIVKSPWVSTKIIVQNIGGSSPTALSASGHTILAGGVAIQF